MHPDVSSRGGGTLEARPHQHERREAAAAIERLVADRREAVELGTGHELAHDERSPLRRAADVEHWQLNRGQWVKFMATEGQSAFLVVSEIV